MKIIDMRCRPPFGKFLEGGLYAGLGAAGLQAFADDYGVGISQAVKTLKMEDLLAEMDANNVERIVTPVRAGEGHDQEANDALITLQNTYPGRIIGVAGIDKFGGQGALDEIDRTVKAGVLGGIIIEPAFGDGVRADDSRIYPIYEKCQADNVACMITFGGRAYKELSCYDPTAIDRIATTFPKLKIALAHGGWPYVTQACALALERPNIYVSPDAYVGNVFGSQDYVMAANYMCRKKIMFGTAFPIFSMTDVLKCWMEAGLRDEVKEDVFYNNALRYFGIE